MQYMSRFYFANTEKIAVTGRGSKENNLERTPVQV